MIRNIIFSFSFRVRDYDICHFQLSALSLVTRKFRQLVYTNSRKRFFLFVGHSGEKRNRKKGDAICASPAYFFCLFLLCRIEKENIPSGEGMMHRFQSTTHTSCCSLVCITRHPVICVTFSLVVSPTWKAAAGGDDRLVEKYHTVRGTEKINPPVRYRNQITAWMPKDDENGRCVGSKRNLLIVI